MTTDRVYANEFSRRVADSSRASNDTPDMESIITNAHCHPIRMRKRTMVQITHRSQLVRQTRSEKLRNNYTTFFSWTYDHIARQSSRLRKLLQWLLRKSILGHVSCTRCYRLIDSCRSEQAASSFLDRSMRALGSHSDNPPLRVSEEFEMSLGTALWAPNFMPL